MGKKKPTIIVNIPVQSRFYEIIVIVFIERLKFFVLRIITVLVTLQPDLWFGQLSIWWLTNMLIPGICDTWTIVEDLILKEKIYIFFHFFFLNNLFI